MTFKLFCKGEAFSRCFRVSNIIDVNEFETVIEMGNRKIILRAATGEQGSDGPFTYVQVLEDEESKAAYCLTRESQFNDLWKFLEAGCR